MPGVADVAIKVISHPERPLTFEKHCLVEYDVLPAVFDIDSALKPDAPLLYEELKSNILPGGTPIYGPNCLTGVVHGDVEKGFAEAIVVTEGTFGYENIPNAIPPESIGAVAVFEPPNKATIWGTSQAPYLDKVTLFHVFNRHDRSPD